MASIRPGISAAQVVSFENGYKRGFINPAERDTFLQCEASATLGNEASEHFHLIVELVNVTDEPATVYRTKSLYDYNIILRTPDEEEMEPIGGRHISRSFSFEYDEQTMMEIGPGESHYYEFKIDIEQDGTLDLGRHVFRIVPGQLYLFYLSETVFEWVAPA